MIFLNLQNFKIQLHLFLLDEILASFYFLGFFILSLFLRLIILTYINFLDFRIYNWLFKCLCYPDDSYQSGTLQIQTRYHLLKSISETEALNCGSISPHV